MGLREEMNRRILGPVIGGVLIAAIISCLIMLISGPQWIDLVEQKSIPLQVLSLRQMSYGIAKTLENYLQSISNDLLTINGVLVSIYEGNIYLNSSEDLSNDPGFTNQSYILNARTVAAMDDPTILQNAPEFNLETNQSICRLMWYVPEPNDEFQYEYWDNVPSALQTYVIYMIIATPILEANVVNSSKYTNIYTGFEYDGVEPSAIFVEYPLGRDFQTYLNFTQPNSNNEFFTVNYFDFLTRPWWQQASRNVSLNNTVIFTDPYRYSTGIFGNTACIPYFSNQEYAMDIRLTCVDYSIDFMNQFIRNSTSITNTSYFLIKRSNFLVILQPQLDNYNTTLTTAPTITELLYTGNSTSDSSQFQSNLETLNTTYYQSEFNNNMTYNLNGEVYFLVIYILQIAICNGECDTMEYIVGFSQPESLLISPLNDLSQNIIDSILIQVLIILGLIVVLFIIALVLVNIIAKYFAGPIDELVRFVKIMKNFSEEKDSVDDLEVLIELNKVRAKSYSQEIDKLFDTFDKNLSAIRFAKEAQNSSNFAEALISYSQSLNLYKILENVRGRGMVYNNIANIYFSQAKYQDAVDNYREAVILSRQELEKLIQFENDLKLKATTKKEKKKDKKIKKKKAPGMSMDSLEKVRWSLEEQLSNRRYQLGVCLSFVAQNETGSISRNLWNEVVEIFEDVIKVDDGNKRNLARVVVCLLDISQAMLSAGNIKAAEQRLVVAEKKFETLEKEQTSEKTDVFSVYSVPVAILKQRLHMSKALYYKKIGKKRLACELFTETLQMGKKFDPRIRKRCLIELKEIFDEQGLTIRVPTIQKMLNSFIRKNKDLIILLDYSNSMGDGGRINFAINSILKVFDNYLRPDDRIAFIRFNMNCDVIFSLIEKKKNTIQLRKMFQDSTKPSGGTALYQAICEGLKLFHKAEAKDNSKWIVALTDGDDNESRVSYEQTFRRLARYDANLIIIGLALVKGVAPRMAYLCKATEDGFFIESANNENLELAFLTVSDVIYGQENLTENVTI